MYPLVVFLLDGLGDRAHAVLGGRSGNEAAATPTLDALAARGSCGLLYAVGPGRAPSSEVAHWSLLGYRPDEFPGRAVFETLGRGQEVSGEHVFAYAALRPAERREDGWWLTGRPDPDRDAEEAARLVERCAIPVTAKGVVNLVITNYGLFEITPEGMALREIAPGIAVDEVKATTGCNLLIPREVPPVRVRR